MNQPKRIPFKDLNRAAWKRLAIVAVIAFYLVLWGKIIINKEFFNPLGLDYLAFWSAGQVASQYSYSQIYDIQLLHQIQSNELAKLGILSTNFAPIPAPLIPVFILPFQLLSALDAPTSFIAWSIINLVGMIAYLIFFTMKISGENNPANLPKQLLVILFLSYPIFHNFYWGQLEVILLICCGEFIRNAIANKPLVSGLWISGLLIKPQILILVIPTLIILKNWRIITGFTISSVVIIGISLLLSGTSGVQSMVLLWSRYLPGLATNHPESMVNWRMVGENLRVLISPDIGWSIAGIGMIAMLVIWYLLLKTKPVFGTSQWIAIMAGIFSLTCALTWHSHMHMMMAIIPFLILLTLKKVIPEKVCEIWVFAVVIETLLLPARGGFGLGLVGLVLNIWLALVVLVKQKKTTSVSQLAEQ